METIIKEGNEIMLVKNRTQKWFRFAGALILLGAVLVPLSLYSRSAYAETDTANILKVSPLRTDVKIKPGESGVVKITVTNLTNKDITVRPYENDFISGDEYGTPSIILDEDKFAPTHSLKRFMAPLQSIKISANKSKTVEVKLNVPGTTQAGGYFGALRFAPTTPDNGGQVNTSASVASLILLTVPGDLVEKLNLTQFDIQQGDKAATNFRTPNDLEVSFRFENKGNVQLAPFGKISVKKGDDVIYDTDFNNKAPSDTILPDGARRWDVPLKNIGTFGHYTVSATFTYGSKNQSIDVTKSFWVIPMVVIIGFSIAVLLLVGLIVWLVFFIRGHHRRSRKTKNLSRSRLR